MSAGELISTGAAGHLLGVSRERVRQLIDQGRLPAMRGPYGMRMIRREAVLKLAQERGREQQRARTRR